MILSIFHVFFFFAIYMSSLSKHFLLYKFNALSILTKHLSDIVGVTFAFWSVIAKPAQISFLFFTVSPVKIHSCCRSYQLPHTVFSLLIESRTFTFSLKGKTLWLLFGRSELPASLLLNLGAIIKSSKGWLNTNTVILQPMIW